MEGNRRIYFLKIDKYFSFFTLFNLQNGNKYRGGEKMEYMALVVVSLVILAIVTR